MDINATARLHSGPYSVGLVVAAIDKYVVFLERLIGSADRYFMNSQNVTYFVFTDNPDRLQNKVKQNDCCAGGERQRLASQLHVTICNDAVTLGSLSRYGLHILY